MRRDAVIENPAINSPYIGPSRHCRFDDRGITGHTVDARDVSPHFSPVLEAGGGMAASCARGNEHV